MVNTGAVQTGFADNGQGGEVTVRGRFNQGLQVEMYRDRVAIKAPRPRDWHLHEAVPLATRI
ncbi:hypothetical protein [Kitasatospora purpeofusca]|uniref:hypothetical protein n=1 Tax=Kitasatospora purpeofusca TaxID=67352 RepID=UPI00364741B9